MKFRPLHDRVVVKRVEEEQKSKAAAMKPASSFPSTSRLATSCCSASGPAPR